MIDAKLAQQIDALRAQATLETVPSGLLAWFGRTDFPDGVADAPALTQQAWESWYLLLQQAALAPGLVPPLFGVKAATAALRPDGPLPIAIASYALAVPRPELVQQVMAAANAGGALADPPTTLADAIRPARAFLAAGLLHDQWGHAVPVYRSRVVTWVVDESFYFANPGSPLPDAIELDPGDGKGARRVAFGQRITVVYPRAAQAATVTVQCTYGDQVLRSQFAQPIGGPAAAPFPDDVWTLTGYPSFNTGKAYVYRAPGHAAVTHPLIVAEGFPGGYPYDYLYEMLNQAGTLESLRASGYDVVLLSFDDGVDLIQDNAQVAIAAIRQAQATAQAPLVAGGVSMGGLVMRYALAWLESRGLPHDARLFFTIDTPHRGAYTDVADQWLASYFAPASALAAGFAALLDSPANQQFMMFWVSQGKVTPSPLREQFLADLASVGSFPRRTRNIALSCGSGAGGTTGAPSRTQLAWSGNPFASALLRTMPSAGGGGAVVAEAYSFLAPPQAPAELVVSSTWSWEAVHGGQDVYNMDAAAIAQNLGIGSVQDPLPVTCGVPTVSALDLDQDPTAPVPFPPPAGSAFAAYACCEQDSPHLTITPAMGAWLRQEIGASAVASPTRTVRLGGFNPAAFNPHDPGFIADPYPTYALFREHAPVAWVDLYRSYWAFGYEEATRVLHDTDTFRKNNPKDPAKPPPPFDVLATLPSGVFTSDPPLHTKLRETLDPLFHEAIAGADLLAASVARPLLLQAKQSRRMELMSAYAYPLPSTVLLTVLGLPRPDWPGLTQWTEAILAGHDITQPRAIQGLAGTCSMAIIAYFQGLLRCPVASLSPGLVELMMTSGKEGGLTDVELQTTALNFLVAGYLSTSFLIGTGVRNLLLNPDQLALLRGDYDRYCAGAIQEMLRYDAPAQLVDRVVAVDEIELGGVKLHFGDTVTAVIGSANRDPAVFPDPDRFDIRRDTTKQVAFGDGIHYCIGAPLVEKVGPVAFRTLLQELPTLTIAGEAQWQTDPYLRSPSSLPLGIA